MIGRTSKPCKDGEAWWRQGSSSTWHHLKNWKVILWAVASLLTLVEDVFSEEDEELQLFPRQRSPSISVHILEEDRMNPVWPKAFDWSQEKARWRRSPDTSHSSRTSRRNRQKTKSSRDCHLEKKELRVRDLGLGYDSDEIVLFKYCIGTCHSFRKHYDLALKALMVKGSISTKSVSSSPCCRPTRYETVSFMDAQTTWQTIKWLSAANCSCVS